MYVQLIISNKNMKMRLIFIKQQFFYCFDYTKLNAIISISVGSKGCTLNAGSGT